MPDSAPPRLSMHDVLRSITETLNLERGIFRTLWDLLVRPRTFFETYFFRDRTKYTKPITLLMLTLAAAVVSCRMWLAEANSYSPNLFLKITAANADELRKLTLLRDYDDVIRLLLVPATSLFSYLLFRHQKWNFAEHLVYNAYLLAFQFFLMAALVPPFGSKAEWLVGAVILAYFLATYLRCLNGFWISTLLRSFAVVVGSNLLFLALLYPLAYWIL